MYLATRGPRAPRKGVVVVLMAFALVAVFGALALSLDGGTLLAERRHAQATADAAALAATCDLFTKYWVNSGADDSGNNAALSAVAVAQANGYAVGATPVTVGGTTTATSTNSTVTVNIPPLSGPYAGTRGYAEVIVQYNETRGFSSLFAGGTIPVKARAVAVGLPIAADVGILVLDPSGKGAFNAQGSGTSTVTNTPVIVDSSDPSAAIAGGGGTLTAPKFLINGGWTSAGNGSFNGPVYTGRAPMPDPLADLPPPDPTTMTQQSNKKTQFTQGSQTLSPGVYKGGISVSGTGSLTLQPGVYYMEGGGFSFSGQGSLYGVGVMIYNAPGNGNSAGVSISGSGSVTLSGMTSGPYTGMTLWQDRTSNVTANISGTSGTTNITGTFYFASALLNITGNGGLVNIGSQYISYDLTLSGNGNLNIDWEPDKVARKRSIYLVE